MMKGRNVIRWPPSPTSSALVIGNVTDSEW